MQSITQTMTGNVMMPLRRIGLPLGWAVLLFMTLVLASVSPRAHAYHFPWDQGHDVTENEDNDDPPGPCEGDQCDPCDSTGSPIYVPTGHFIWSDTDVTLSGRPNLSLRRTYNSHDPRDGMFGNGWSSTCEPSLYKTVREGKDGEGNATAQVLYQLLLPNGKRYSYEEQDGGTVQSPASRFDTLEPQPDGTVILTARSGAHRVFGASGEILSRVDRNGNATHYRYDASGRLTRLEDDNGRYLDFNYNASGRVSEVEDHTQRRWFYDYDTDGNLVAVTDPMNGTYTYEYQPFTNVGDNEVYYQLTRVVDAAGVTVTAVTYDGVRATSYTEGENRYTYSYDPDTRTVTKTDSTGTTRQFVYNDDQVIVEKRIRTASGTWRTTQYEYDSNGNKIKMIDPAGQEWLKDYDAQGRLLSTTNPLGETTTYTYDGDKPWPVTITSPSGRETHYTYNDQGNPVTITDPMQQDTTLNWNSQGDLLQVTDSLGRTLAMTYNGDGQVTSVTDGEDRTTTYQYDALGRRIQVTLPNGDTQQWSYDANNRPTTQINGMGEDTQFQYDPAGRLTQLIDGEGHPLAFDYDDHGRLIAEHRPDGQTLAFSYREDGDLASKTTPNNETISYQYDTEKRLTKQTLPRLSYSFSYTQRGQLASVSGTNGTSSAYSYDAAGRRVGETPQGRSINIGYNAEGEATTLTVAGETQTLTRNNRGQITALNTPAGNYGFQYDDAGQLTGMSYPGGSAQYQYNQAGQVAQQQLGDTLNTAFTYQYDQNGRLSQRGGEGADWQYGYDAANQLSNASHGTDSYGYQYDKNGNRLEQGQQYDPFNKLLNSQGAVYSNDDSGNRTKKVDAVTGEITEYQYDALNRLTQITKRPAEGEPDTLTATYQYDAFNRRVEKTVVNHTDGSTETTEFLWLGSQLVAEYANGSGQASKRYRYGNGFAPISYTENGSDYSVHSDHLDTPKRITNSQGETVWEAVLSPYGLASVNADPDGDEVDLAFNLRFPGQYQDRESGLYYNMRRFYDPDKGQYITSDPIGVNGGINNYIYVESNPVAYFDPFGFRKIGQPGVADNDGPGNGSGRTGVFGCIVGCASYIEGDPEAQASLSPTLGGGFMVCSSPPEPNNENSCPVDKPEDGCGMYDPNCDNNFQPSGSVGRGGAGIGVQRNADGSVCVLIGLFVSGGFVSPTYNLGGLSE